MDSCARTNSKDSAQPRQFSKEKKREEKKKEGQKRNYSCSENAKFSADVEGVEEARAY